jgi:hypothetical protein
MSSGIICQGCGVEAPTKFLEFHQNIGALVVRFSKTYRGNLCKRCAHKYFWQASATTLFLGPWGTISLVLAPAYLINNIVRYVTALTMPGVPADARVPVLDEVTFGRLAPYGGEIAARLNAGESLGSVATHMASTVGATPGQVVHFISHLARQAPAQQPPTGGFPVIPVASTSASASSSATPPPLPVRPV